MLPRVWDNIGSCIQVQVACPHFDISFGCFVFGLKSLAFQKITVGLDRSFFIGGGWTVRACGYVMFCHVLSLGLPLTAPLYQFRMVQAHFTNVAGCKNIVKNAFVRLKLQENGCPIQSEPLTIQVIPHNYTVFHTV